VKPKNEHKYKRSMPPCQNTIQAHPNLFIQVE
jgi:hypothetical protein